VVTQGEAEQWQQFIDAEPAACSGCAGDARQAAIATPNRCANTGGMSASAAYAIGDVGEQFPGTCDPLSSHQHQAAYRKARISDLGSPESRKLLRLAVLWLMVERAPRRGRPQPP